MDRQTTYFDRFPNSPNPEEALIIDKLLSWVEELPAFCALFGSMLTVVKKDIEGNLHKIRNAQKLLGVVTFEDILITEKEQKSSSKDSSGTTGLLWLLRAVEFVFEFLCFLVNDKSGCSRTVIQQAYARSLKRHHNFIIAKVFDQLARLAPDRHAIMEKLKNSPDVTDEEVIAKMKTFTREYYPCIDCVQSLVIKYAVEKERPCSSADHDLN